MKILLYDRLTDDNKEGVYVSNSYYKTTEFTEKYKYAFFKILT